MEEVILQFRVLRTGDVLLVQIDFSLVKQDDTTADIVDGVEVVAGYQHGGPQLKAQFQKERKEALNRPATNDELQNLADKFNGRLF